MAYAVVQEKANDDGANGTNIASGNFGASVTVGNHIIAVVTVGNSDVTGSGAMTDTLGNTYVRRGTIWDTNNNQGLMLFDAKITTGGTNAVTGAWGGTSLPSRGVYAVEVSGLDTTTWFQAGAIASANQASPGTSADGVSSGNLTPTAQPALLFGFAMNIADVATIAAGTGFTGLTPAWQLGTGVNLMRPEHKRLTATSAVPATFTAASDVRHLSIAAAYSEAGGGGGGGANLLVGKLGYLLRGKLG